MKKEKITIVVTGVLIGVISAMLVFLEPRTWILYRLFLTGHYRSIGTPFCSWGNSSIPSGDHRAGAWCMHRVTDYKGISSERWFGTGYQIYTGSFCYDRMSDVPWVSVPNDPASGWW